MALKTNSKAAKKNILSYVLKHASNYLLCDFGIEADENNIYSEIWRIFNREAVNAFDRGETVPEAFKSWAQGLAMGDLFCYYYNREAVGDVAEILEETPEEAARFTEEEAEEFLTNLLFREIRNAVFH